MAWAVVSRVEFPHAIRVSAATIVTINQVGVREERMESRYVQTRTRGTVDFMRRRLFLLFLVLALASGACGGAGVGDDLEGRQFWSTSVTEDGVERALVPGTTIQLRFDGDNIGASAGCNSMGGTFRIDGDTLLVTEMGMTEMGCDPARHDQDNFVAALLADSPTITLAGDELTVETDTVRLEMLDATVANPDVPIVGTAWEVTGFIDAEAATSMNVSRPGTVTFSDESTMTGFDGCGDFSASVEVSDGSTGGPVEGDGEVQFGPVDRLTTAGCADAEYAAMLHAVFDSGDATITVDGQNMTLMSRQGRGVTLRAAS